MQAHFKESRLALYIRGKDTSCQIKFQCHTRRDASFFSITELSKSVVEVSGEIESRSTSTAFYLVVITA